jgi:hypothetical protein
MGIAVIGRRTDNTIAKRKKKRGKKPKTKGGKRQKR